MAEDLLEVTVEGGCVPLRADSPRRLRGRKDKAGKPRGRAIVAKPGEKLKLPILTIEAYEDHPYIVLRHPALDEARAKRRAEEVLARAEAASAKKRPATTEEAAAAKRRAAATAKKK